MVSKNNVQVKDRHTTQQVPHYGIRKLSVGVASVLLGTTFYMGINGNVAHADTVNSQDHEMPDSQVANNNSNGNSDSTTEAPAAVTNEVNTKPQVTEITNGSHEQSDTANGVKSDASAAANVQSDAANTNVNTNSVLTALPKQPANAADTQPTAAINSVQPFMNLAVESSQLTDQPTDTPSTSSETTKPATAWQPEPPTNYSADHTAKIDMTNQSTTVEGDNWQMSLDKNYIKAGRDATLTVNYQAQAGDTFVLDIGYPSGVNAQPLNSQVGTTSTKDNG